jgi:hypothetical protein
VNEQSLASMEPNSLQACHAFSEQCRAGCVEGLQQRFGTLRSI